MLSDHCLSVISYLSVCNVGVFWPDGWIDQYETCRAGRPRPWPPCVRWDPPPPPKGHSPQFSAHVCCGQMAGWIKMPLVREVGLDPSNIVLEGTQLHPPLKGGGSPIFCSCLLWPNGWMDQDATWYGGRPWLMRHCVRWGPSSPPLKRAQLPLFDPCLLWPNGWMDEDASWYEGRHQPGQHCVRRRPNSTPPWGTASPNFRSMSVVVKWLDGSRCHLVQR